MRPVVVPTSLFAAIGFSLLAACHSSGAGYGAATPTQNDTFVVEINNENFLDAEVFSWFEGSGEHRLGTVFGHSRDTFVLRWQPRDLVFKVDLIGAGTFLTDPPITVSPEDILEVHLPARLHRGAAGFRRIR